MPLILLHQRTIDVLALHATLRGYEFRSSAFPSADPGLLWVPISEDIERRLQEHRREWEWTYDQAIHRLYDFVPDAP